MLGEIEPNPTGSEFSCSDRTGSICSIFVLVWGKEAQPRVQESDNEILFQNGADPLNSLSQGFFATFDDRDVHALFLGLKSSM